MCPKSRPLARTDIRRKVTGTFLVQGMPSQGDIRMRLKFAAITTLIAALSASSQALGAPIYTIEQAVAVAQAHNPEIEIARKKVQGAHGGWVEARSGYLPWLSSTGLVDKRQQQTETRLRDEDYNAIVKLEQNLYTGGAVSNQVSIARLNVEKQNCELQYRQSSGNGCA